MIKLLVSLLKNARLLLSNHMALKRAIAARAKEIATIEASEKSFYSVLSASIEPVSDNISGMTLDVAYVESQFKSYVDIGWAFRLGNKQESIEELRTRLTLIKANAVATASLVDGIIGAIDVRERHACKDIDDKHKIEDRKPKSVPKSTAA